MQNTLDRRAFVKYSSLLAGGAVFAHSRLAWLAAKTDKPQRFRVGFAPATDGTLDSYWMRMKALSEVGLRNIEVDNGMVKIAEAYASKPAEFHDRMAKLNLQLVGVNQPYQFADPSTAAAIKDKNTLVGKFLKDVGATYLGWEGALAPGATGEQVEVEDQMRQIARLANEEGKRIKEQYGIRFTYHTHSTFGFRRLMDLTNPAYLSLNPDLGWLRARGNGDALEILRAYRSRLMTIHFKDFDPNREWNDRGTHGKGGMVVPGQGAVNFPAVVEFLKESDFDGFVLGEYIGLGNYDFVNSTREPEVYPKFKQYFAGTLGLKL
ncbi:MAG TPA: TIM barrel protein [Bryobacteraceae bacterium]|nr:TIM barrel protein [Bryobacteraceae bacterium]